MFKVVSLVLLFSVLLLGVTFTQNSYAAQHPFELKWGSSGLAKPGMFLNPQQLAVDLENNIYVSDHGNARIQIFDDQGNYIKSWGSYGDGPGEFSHPAGIAISHDYVFVVDNKLNKIQKFDSLGNFIIQWGSFGTGNSEFISPSGIAVSENEFVYVVDTGNNRIQKFTLNGEYVSSFGKNFNGEGNLVSPRDIAIDETGKLFVTDPGNKSINIYKNNGEFLRILDSSVGGFSIFPTGIIFDENNNFYISDQKNNRIIQFNEYGVTLSVFGTMGDEKGQFKVPKDVTIDNKGFLYVVDSLAHQIQKFSTPIASEKLIIEAELKEQEAIQIQAEESESLHELEEISEVKIELEPVKPIPNDFKKPVIFVPEDLIIEATSGLTFVNIGQADATDESGILSLSNNAPELFPLGITTIIWTSIDGSGNMAISPQTITVKDTTPAEIEQLPEITFEAKSETQNLIPLEIPLVSDAVGVISLENNAPEVFPLGETIVTWTATDVMQNISTMEQKIILTDSIFPRVAIPEDIIIEATSINENSVSFTEPEVFDYVKIESLSNDAPEFFPIGETTVTWTVSDSSGNVGTSSHKVTVLDSIPPEITVSDVTIEATIPSGSDALLSIPEINDIQEVYITNDAPDVFPFGNTVVTWTVKDQSDNESTQTQNVNVVDTSKPILITPSDIEIESTGIETIIDDLGEIITEDVSEINSISNDAPESFPLGETIVTWTATDTSGNSVSDTQLITVVDTTLPQIIAPSDVILEAVDPLENYVELSNGRIFDRVEIESVENDAPEFFPLGETIVTWTATDTSGNSASDTQRIIIEDTIQPVITGPEDITLEITDISGITVDIGQASAFDDVDQSPNIINDAPELFQIGDTIVTWVATDSSENSSLYSQTITVIDTTSPELIIPNSVTQEAENLLSNYVTLENPQTSDIIGVSSITNDAPEVFPLGETIVTWTATDTSGNSVSDTQLITVVDTTAPSILEPENIIAEATGLEGNVVELDLIIAEDNVGVGSIINDAPTTFGFGTTIVSWTVSDDAGNTETIQQNISLVDTTVPSIILPNNIETEAVSNHSNIIEIGIAIGSDNIQLGQVTNDAPESFPLGETIVTWTATDTSGNSVSDTQLITVVDTTAPSILEPENIIVEATSSSSNIVELNLPIADDAISNVIIDNNAPDVFPFGETIVTWSAEDESGNISYTDHKVIIVDTSAPELQIPVDIMIDATSLQSIVEIDSPQTSDIIGVSSITNDAPESFPLGETIVTWTATDTSGNSVSDTQLITVQICGNLPSYYNMIMGTAEDDFITGTNLPDLIFSNGGDDIIIGNNGNDCIFAGEGNDIVFGNSGDDNITGGQGNDIVKGDSGDDILKGGIGLDMIDGGDDIDRCIIIDEQNNDLIVKCEVNE